MPATVLITGAAGGLGAATASEFLAHGWQVFAADIAPPPAAERLIPVDLDVTSDDSVAAAVAEVSRHVDALAAVINFAGILDLGPMLEIPAERFGRIFEINVIGMHRVNRAFFPLVRAGHGRIVNISSEAAMLRGGATSGPYSASKHAVEAYSDALRQELMFVDVPVIVIRPGSFHTEMSQSISAVLERSAAPDSPFAPAVRFAARMSAKDEANAKDPRILARGVYAAVTDPKPKPYYAFETSTLRRIGGNLPPQLLDRLVRKATRADS